MFNVPLPSPARIGPLIAVLTLVLVTLSATPASAGEAPFGRQGRIFYSDSSNLTYRAIECNHDHHLHFNHFMYFTMENDYEAQTNLMTTKLTARECGSNDREDDIYWYATAQRNLTSERTLGRWDCIWANATECSNGRIKLAERMYDDGTSNATKWNVLCHEVAHALGFSHGDTGNNCMDGGNNGIIDQYMIDKINGYYK